MSSQITTQKAGKQTGKVHYLDSGLMTTFWAWLVHSTEIFKTHKYSTKLVMQCSAFAYSLPMLLIQALTVQTHYSIRYHSLGQC